MSNFKADILYAAEGKPITAIVISDYPRCWEYTDPFWTKYSRQDPVPKGFYKRVLTWEEVEQYLDYEYNSSFGARDCHDIRFWTEDKVFYVHEYDGSTDIHDQPRNPTAEA